MVATHLSQEHSRVPYSDRPRCIEVRQISVTHWYAFDYRQPSDVVLLSKRGAHRLQELLRGEPATESPLDRALARVGLSHELLKPQSPIGSRLLSVWIQLVNVCNFGCYYCYIPQLGKNIDPNLVNAKTMKTDDFALVLDRLIAFCKSTGLVELHLKFAGGEPTLNIARLEKFCAMAKAKETSALRISFGMISNGSFDLKAVEQILRTYDIQLSLSIDGYAESHDRIRYERDDRLKIGSWRRVSDNARALSASGYPPYLLYTVTKANHLDIDRFADFAHDERMGYRLSLVRSPRVVSESKQLEILASLKRHYSRLGCELSVCKPISRFARFSEWNLVLKKSIACSTCRGYFAVGQNGEVSSCQMTLDDPLGHSRNESFGEIIARARTRGNTKALANVNERQGVCSTCTYFHVCAGGCPQHTISVYGTASVPSPWCKVYGGLLPVYVEAIAKQMERKHTEQTAQAS